MKKLMIIISFLLFTGLLYSEGKNPPDYSSKINSVVKANNGTLTSALVKALMQEAVADGTEGETAMAKALFAKYPNDAVMIAKTVLGCCSDGSVIAIANLTVANCSDKDGLYQDLYSVSVANNSDSTVSAKLELIFGINTGGGGGGGTGGAQNSGTVVGSLPRIVTEGGNTNNNENPASP